MFGSNAPIWPFLARFGGAADPLAPVAGTSIIETYPVLAVIALGWTLPDARPAGRLPKYNPERTKTFSIADWRHVCRRTSRAFHERGVTGLGRWLDDATILSAPRKRDQDRLDACLCLLAALHLADGRECLMIGTLESGYVVVPHGSELHQELIDSCERASRAASQWLHRFQLAQPLP